MLDALHEDQNRVKTIGVHFVFRVNLSYERHCLLMERINTEY